MTRHMFDHPSHPEGLRDELLAADIPVSLVMRDPEDEARTIVDVPDEYRDAAEAIVLAHDAASYEAAEADKRRTFDDAAAFLKNYYKTPNANITDAMTKNAVKALSVVARKHNQELALGE